VEALRERFGKYHVLEKLAQGGMAEVYKVKAIGIAGFEKVQALKRILPHQAREPKFIRSFIDEARIAVELTHRNIVQVFDFGKADGELFLAMELIEGKDLRTAMQDAVEAPPPVQIAAYIVSEVASGLDYAHRKADGYGRALGIVHCDVSPSNVMLSVEGDIKILDFGISRARFASALERRRLRGKPRYMAPEQTLGEPPSAASDVFALGIVAWELFTGTPLYRGHDLKAILEAVRQTVPARIDQLNPSVPAVVADGVARALTQDPAERGTASDLAAACARAAMTAGPRALARWLAHVAARPARTSGWQPVVTAIHVPSGLSGDAEPSVVHPMLVRRAPASAESRPARPSETISIPGPPPGSRPPPALSDLTRMAMTPPPVRSRVELEPAEHTQVAPAPPMTARFERDPERTTAWPGAPASPGRPATRGGEPDAGELTLFGASPPTAPFEVDAERTAIAGAPRPSGEFDGVDPVDRRASSTSAPETERFVRLSEDDTAHGAPPAGDPGNTSYDEFEIESDAPAVASSASAALGEAPIDDDLGELAAGALAERRRVVVVAALVTGAPGDAVRPITKSLGELAYQRGGVVLELASGELVVAFGLEVAGEDDVAVAMGWAVDAAAMARDTAAAQVHIGARAGVATAPSSASAELARIAAPTVTVARTPETAMRIPDDAIEEARALAREAAADRPLFVGGAGRLTSSLYALRELPPSRRTGRRGRVIEVVGPRGFQERDRARLERRGTFVGRTAQLGELERWLERAIAVDRRLSVLLTGPAGIGKSRLVAELVWRRAAAGTPLRVITTAANPTGLLAPFATVIDLYQAALGLPPSRGRSARAQVAHRLHDVLTGAGIAAERARAITSDLERAMELRDGVAIGARETADLRSRISVGLGAFRSVMASRERPALTVVEDVQLADSASLEVLRHALAMPASGPELLVLTARPEGLQPPSVDQVIELGDLAGGDLRALIVDRLGEAATPTAIATLLARGGGNPMFLEELAQAVRDSGAEHVPASARDVVSARIDRLPPKAKTALRFASLLGSAVRVRLLEELLGEDGLDAELDELVAAGFLIRPGDGAADGELAFARGLVREVVYESLSARALRDSHARVGRLLASRFFAGREEPPAAIAEHLERGGETAGAAAFWLRAGRLALSASDAGAAIACFTRTLGLERELGEPPPRPTSKARRREALAGREEAHRLQGDLAADPGDLDELARLCAGEPARLADVAIRRAQRLLRLGDYRSASDATAIAEVHAITAGDDRLRGEALRVRSEVLERVGRFDEALDVVGLARELFHRQHAVADEMAAMIGRGRIHLLRAHYEAARDAYRPVLARIARTGDPWLERIVQNHVAVIEMCLGNFAVAMQCALRSLELCRRYGDRGREGDSQSVAGIVLLEVGLHDQAATMFAGALDTLSRTNSRWSRADCLIYSGICEQRRGRSGGLRMLDEALAEARRLGARYLEANALVARAGAHLQTGALTAAASDAADGAAVAREATLVSYEIQGLARQAVALDRLGRRTTEAAALADRALQLLDVQRYLEGSEEEVLVACAAVLHAAGERDRAHALRLRGRASAQRKLAALHDATWRAAYAQLPEIAELLR
jgi:serine/threonine protein kinase/tetratricopeptide (TPR) repeat protein